ncbi:hypothetical protein Tco_0261454 [Tanacetum coccineum]
MAEIKTKTTMEEFLTKDRANYYSGITSITVNSKDAYELKGKILDDLLENAFSGTNGEDANEHIEYFLKIVDPIDLPNVNYERVKLSVFPISLVGNASKWFEEFKGSITTWVDTKLFTHDIERTKTYKDYKNELNNEVDEPWSDNGVHYEICDHIFKPFRFKNGKTKWHICNLNEYGFYNGGELPGMVRVGYMAYFQNHEWSFKNIHKLDYELLVNLQECWWKINIHECSPFDNWRNHILGPYTNIDTPNDPYLDGRNGKANNNGDIQEEVELHKSEERCDLFDNPAKSRRFARLEVLR